MNPASAVAIELQGVLGLSGLGGLAQRLVTARECVFGRARADGRRASLRRALGGDAERRASIRIARRPEVLLGGVEVVLGERLLAAPLGVVATG